MKKYLRVIYLTVCLLFFVSNISLASIYNDPRTHTTHTSFSGAYTNFNGGNFTGWTPELDSYWTPTFFNRFALKAMWLPVNNDGDRTWLEVGFMDGGMKSGTKHHGFYTAEGRWNSNFTDVLYFYDYAFVNSHLPVDYGLNNKFEITYVGNNNYKIVLNDVVYKNFYYAPGGEFMEVGMETNYAGSHWNNNYANNLSRKDSSGTWGPWTSGVPSNSDDLNTGYTSVWNINPTSLRFYKP